MPLFYQCRHKLNLSVLFGSNKNTDITPAFSLLYSQAVREFLCLDDPPGPFDSLEESRVSVHTHHLKTFLKERSFVPKRLYIQLLEHKCFPTFYMDTK